MEKFIETVEIEHEILKQLPEKYIHRDMIRKLFSRLSDETLMEMFPLTKTDSDQKVKFEISLIV
jgi:hypothetical protein